VKRECQGGRAVFSNPQRPDREWVFPADSRGAESGRSPLHMTKVGSSLVNNCLSFFLFASCVDFQFARNRIVYD